MEKAALIRLTAFSGVLLVMAAWEVFFRRRVLSDVKARRWRHNLGIILLNNGILRLAAPLLPVAVAHFASVNGLGLFNAVDLSPVIAFIFALLILDLVIYLQHVMFHAVPNLWRLHMVHHADLDIDVTTGIRFHPVEILISTGIKNCAVLAFGIGPAAVVAFEVLLNATAMFNHGNVYMPAAVDRIIRAVIVTPDMHRVHHSVVIPETNSNFGFCLSWWDWLLGTYRAQPEAGHAKMTIGISHVRKPMAFGRLLAMPFTHAPGGYTINGVSGRNGQNRAG